MQGVDVHGISTVATVRSTEGLEIAVSRNTG